MRMISPSCLVGILGVVAVSALGGCGSELPGASTPASASAEKASGGSDGKGIKQGDKAPQFAMDSMNGAGKMTIAPGKVTIVDFWATWCEPCKKSFPKLQELYVKYKSSGLEIIAISVDDDKKGVPGFVKANGDAKFLVVWDKDHAVANAYKPDSMPTTFILDKSGNIAHTHKGYRDGEIDEMEKEIKALF